MALIHIDLQEGFEDDEVIILMNGDQVFHKTGVTTRTQIGLADSVEVTAGERSVSVTVRLPLKDVSADIGLDGGDENFVGISIVDGDIVSQVSDTPFGYL